MKKFFFWMVVMVVALVLTSCNEKYTLFFDNGIITLRAGSDLSQNQLNAIQEEIEEVIANKAMTAKEIRKSVTAVMKDKTGTNNLSYSVDFGTGKTKIRITVLKPIETIGVWIFGIGGVFCALCLLYSFLKMFKEF